MKGFRNLFKMSVLFLNITALHAAPTGFGPPNPQAQTLVDYLKHLGEYLGYEIGQKPTAPVSDQLLPLSPLQAQAGQNTTMLGTSYLSSLLSTTIPPNQIIPLVPSGSSPSQPSNGTLPNYGQASSGGTNGNISALTNIDQQPYQSDPVSQALLNLLSTPPDQPTCTSLTANNSNATCLNLLTILNNAILPPQTPQGLFSITATLPQLNSNTLLSPLMYTAGASAPSTSSPSPQSNKPTGLPTQNTAQLASDFIRYASGTIVPLTLPTYSNIDTASPQGIAALAQYMANLRIYAAQVSVGLSNLYYLLSKRMPQTVTGADAGSSGQTSEALNEYNMATWRLFLPPTTTGGSALQPNTQWKQAINQASSATVQKEIAVLLAEINYQLYLTRQQQERMLLTNTTLLLMSARTGAPLASSLTSGGSPSTGNSSSTPTTSGGG